MVSLKALQNENHGCSERRGCRRALWRLLDLPRESSRQQSAHFAPLASANGSWGNSLLARLGRQNQSEYKVKRFLEGALMTPARAHVYWNGTFSDAEKKALVRQPLPGSLKRVLSEIDGLPATSDDLAPYLWLDQRYYLADDILTKSDRMSMAHSVEVRPPFLDHRLVEFAAKLPASLKIRGGQQKVILKELMKDMLPPAILERPKIGFDIPAHEWLRGPLLPLLTDALHHGASQYGDVFRPEVMHNLLRLHLERKANLGYHLWGLLILFLWMRKWRIQAASSETPKVLLQVKAGASA